MVLASEGNILTSVCPDPLLGEDIDCVPEIPDLMRMLKIQMTDV